MLRNYVISSFRSILKRKLHSGLNILGLAIGMAGSLLIIQYVSFERSYNDFHENKDEIYRISYSKEKNDVESFNTVLTYSGVGKLMKEQFPEVKDFVRLRPASVITSTALIRYGEDIYEEEDVYFTDPSFFKIFSFELIEGDVDNALKDQFTAIITESMAKKYFGDADPIGKTIRKGRDENYLITGIMRDTPANSHFNVNLLLSHSTLSAIMYEQWTEDNLSVFHGHLYLLAEKGTNPDLLEEKFPDFVLDFVNGRELANQNVVLKLGIMSLTDIHLSSHIQHEAEINGDKDIVNYMTIIGLLILFIAIINYVNLSTARAMERSKEIGIRKVNGAGRSSLMMQFFVESFVINLLAIAAAVLLVFLAQPSLSGLGAVKLQDSAVFYQGWFWMTIGGLWIVASLLSGFYPALILSGYHPVTVLKGKLTTNTKSAFFRKGLVVFQFICSISLIIGTIIIYNQITFMRAQKLGMNIDDKLVLKGPGMADSTYNSKYTAFKNALLQMPLVESVSASQSIPGKEFNSATWFTRVDNPEADSKFCYINVFDTEFARKFEFQFIAGRNFSETDERSILVNRAMVELFEFDDPEDALGKSVTAGDPNNPESNKWRIVGVVDNFNQQSLKNDFSPVIMFRNENASKFYSIQLSARNISGISSTLDFIKEQWLEYFPGNPFNYYFLRDGFDAQYKSELAFGRLFSIFSGLAIVVGVLGLIGLSTYSIQQRTKEVGIRKVLGSSIANISILLGKEIFWLIVVASLVSWPLCLYVFTEWLNGFAFRTEMTIWPFLTSFIVIVAIAIGSVGYQIVKASIANPVDSLKYE